jgi:hypothetical protein
VVKIRNRSDGSSPAGSRNSASDEGVGAKPPKIELEVEPHELNEFV